MPVTDDLARGLWRTGAIKFGDFVLKSGVHSPFYINLRFLISVPVVYFSFQTRKELLQGQSDFRWTMFFSLILLSFQAELCRYPENGSFMVMQSFLQEEALPICLQEAPMIL